MLSALELLSALMRGVVVDVGWGIWGRVSGFNAVTFSVLID